MVIFDTNTAGEQTTVTITGDSRLSTPSRQESVTRSLAFPTAWQRSLEANEATPAETRSRDSGRSGTGTPAKSVRRDGPQFLETLLLIKSASREFIQRTTGIYPHSTVAVK